MAYFTIQDLRIMLGCLHLFMAEHFTDSFDRYTIGQCYSGRKSVPRHMLCEVFPNAAEICNFFEVCIHLLIAKHRQ